MTSHPAVLATAFHTNHIRDRGIPISFVNTPQRVPQGERQAYTTRTTISPSAHLPPPSRARRRFKSSRRSRRPQAALKWRESDNTPIRGAPGESVDRKGQDFPLSPSHFSGTLLITFADAPRWRFPSYVSVTFLDGRGCHTPQKALD